MSAPVLALEGLTVAYLRQGKPLRVLFDVTFAIGAGETFGLVGESGCGKSTVALAIMRYLPPNGRVQAGRIRLEDEDVLALDEERLRRFRGRRMAMVYQDPGSALNPSLRVGEQIAEVYRFHEQASRREALERARELLERVAIPDPGRALRRYPHQLSGGQQQRVVIAIALAGNPQLLVLDEPTTGLDATVEAEVLDLLAALRAELDAGILFISHNLGLVAQMCERAGVLYAGRIVEEGPARELFDAPRHPYTLGLVRCVPRFGVRKDTARLQAIPGSLPALGETLPGCTYEPRCPLARERCRVREPELSSLASGRASRCYYYDEVAAIPAVAAEGAGTAARRPPPDRELLLEVKRLRKAYRDVVACDDVSLELRRGEILGLVGESGSGKTTLARCLAGLAAADGGELRFRNLPVPVKVEGRDGATRQALQMVFQHPDSTLNPRHTARSILRRAIVKLGGSRQVHQLAADVRLRPRDLELRADELSGGLKQRVAIGRAFAGRPELVLCDEPVSALDVSVQAAILNLLADLATREGVSYIFISHDLAVVRYLADRIAVMYLAELVEIGSAEDVFSPPQHPYTEALLSAIPTLDREPPRERIRLQGAIPSLANPPSGCRFHTRCPRKLGAICETEPPPWHDADGGHLIRCHIPAAELRELQTGRSLRWPRPDDPRLVPPHPVPRG